MERREGVAFGYSPQLARRGGANLRCGQPDRLKGKRFRVSVIC